MKYPIIVILCAVSLVACANRRVKTKTQTDRPRAEKALDYGYKIINSHPHDTDAYTQGLFWHEGSLYESTGEYRHSTLRRVELSSGRVIREAKLSDDYFAEGAAILDGKIYQLTWLEKTCFVYDAETFEKTGEFAYKGEGWGLATDGKNLYMSDGTANISVIDPATFRVVRTMAVRNGSAPVQLLNELEWIDGRIWANIYTTEKVAIIDPADGRVEGIVDFSGIETRLTVTSLTDVMNGIAHDPATGRIWVTGKNWNRLFEIEIVKK